MSDPAHEGGCQCGSVRFSTTGKPFKVMACHCTTCKQRTGAAFGIGLYFRDEEVKFNDGERASFTFHSETSGRWLKNEFCPKCGSAITWTLEMRPGLRAVAGGSYDDPDWYTIECHLWTEAARSDMRYPDHVQQFKQALVSATTASESK